nr:o acyltransferase (membrane bound) domain [Hymenolepis microstoma]
MNIRFPGCTTWRLCRARLRPCFLKSYWHHRLYDIITNLGALFCLNYLGCAFSLIDVSMVFKFWGMFYFLGHVVPVVMLFLLPYILPSVNREPTPQKSVVGVSYELNLNPESGAPLVTATTSRDKDLTLGKSK